MKKLPDVLKRNLDVLLVSVQHAQKPFRLLSNNSPNFFDFFMFQQGFVKFSPFIIYGDVLHPTTLYLSSQNAVVWKGLQEIIRLCVSFEGDPDMNIGVIVILRSRDSILSVVY
jgi:hypothetical protein